MLTGSHKALDTQRLSLPNFDALHQLRQQKGSRGFTLIELSIVLVVVGLIAGALAVGKTMMHNAKLQSVVAEWQNIKAAIVTFEQTHDCLPGDCANATEVFGSNTRNGNGDRIIGYIHAAQYENYNAWYQLSAEGLIPQKMETIYSLSNINSPKTPGVHFPQSKLGEDYHWGFGYNNHGEKIQLGKGSGSHTEITNASLGPDDALYIDQKQDDGIPTSGDTLANGSCRQGNAYRTDGIGTCILTFLNVY